MPFNSNINSYHSFHESPMYKDKNKNEYNFERDDELDTLQLPKFKYKPTKADVVTRIVENNETDDEDDFVGGSKIGKWIKKQKKKAKKTINKTADKVKKETKKATDKTVKGIKQVSYKADRDTRGLQSEFERSATKDNGLIKSIITRTLDEVPAIAGDAAAAAAIASGNPGLAPAAKYATVKSTKVGRNVLKDKTGYGSKNINEIIDKYVPGYKQDVKPRSNARFAPTPRPTSRRNYLVKQVMKEQNLSMPKASKYITDNNLYQR